MHKVFRALDVVSDVIYLMDIVIQSRTAFLEDGCLVSYTHIVCVCVCVCVCERERERE